MSTSGLTSSIPGGEQPPLICTERGWCGYISDVTSSLGRIDGVAFPNPEATFVKEM